MDPLPCLHFILQNQEGVAEEEVRGEIWLPDHFTQHGEDARAYLVIGHSDPRQSLLLK